MHCGTLPDFRRSVPFTIQNHHAKTMKKLKSFLAVLLSVVALLSVTGCKTTPTPESIQSKAKGIAYLVTAETLRERPNWKEHFRIASYEFEALAAATNVTLKTITDIVTQLPAKQLKSERAQMYITVGTLFLQDEISQIALTQPEELRRAVLGAHQGIDLALSQAK